MKKILLLLLVLAVVAIAYQLIIISQSFAAETVGGIPHGVAREPDFDFGEVLEGETVTHSFAIENTGMAPLKVLSVRTSCGCTNAERPDTVAPGASGPVVVKANTRGYGGRVFRKTITVTTDDPKRPQIRLHLSGKVAQFAIFEPEHLYLNGNAGDPLQAEATITPSPEHRFKIVKTATDRRLSDKVAVSVTERNGVYHLTVRNLLAAPAHYGGNILITTDNALRPELRLYVRGRIEARKAGS